jgi:hypothetical protein
LEKVGSGSKAFRKVGSGSKTFRKVGSRSQTRKQFRSGSGSEKNSFGSTTLLVSQSPKDVSFKDVKFRDALTYLSESENILEKKPKPDLSEPPELRLKLRNNKKKL